MNDSAKGAIKFYGCPVCRERGLPSKSVRVNRAETLLAWSSEVVDGETHVHNPNRSANHYRCVHGHEWATPVLCPVDGCSFNVERVERLLSAGVVLGDIE